MNKFNRVIKHFGSPTKTALALGVTVQAICFWRDGERQINPKICVLSEKLTDGKVTRKDLRPKDFAEIWPELANND